MRPCGAGSRADLMRAVGSAACSSGPRHWPGMEALLLDDG